MSEFLCKYCDLQLNSSKQWTDHLIGRKHKSNVLQQKLKEDMDSSLYGVLQSARLFNVRYVKASSAVG